MALSQSTRTVRLSTALGPDALGIRQIVFREALGQPFSLEIAAVAEQPDIDLDALVGTNLTVAIESLTGRKSRFVNAFVTEAALTGVEERLYSINLTGAPWFWLLTLSQTCRIFEDMTAPEIVAAVLDEQNLGRYRLELEGTYPALRYCVQYNESDFAFISRLLEREGIYYYFEHTNGAHELVLTDSTGRLQPLPGYERLPFLSATQRQRDAECVQQWQPKCSLRPTCVALPDYNPDQPTADMLAESAIARHHRATGFEVYAYPGGYTQRSDGVERARVRVEALQGAMPGSQPAARYAAWPPGQRSRSRIIRSRTMTGITTSSRRYTASARRATRRALVRVARATMSASTPLEAPFRPPAVTSWPRIAGSQTAIVTGADGEEVDPSTHVAVKVAFHWLPATPSCWIRTSQPWASAGWGSMAIPRIGDEVVVAFEDGDPDRPLIVGSVYNGASRPPYDPVA